MKLHQLYALKTRALAEGRMRTYHRVSIAIHRRIQRFAEVA